jgi:hypothetical protein
LAATPSDSTNRDGLQHKLDSLAETTEPHS